MDPKINPTEQRLFMENESIKRQDEMTWLEHLQKNSWEPEVIISGISLAFLFVIPTKLFEFSVILIQDYGLEQIPASLILVYFSLIISVFKIFLITHLIMRFMWAGMLGITYAFPNGVVKDRLFKYSQTVDYPHPNTYLIKLERWCSMMYGFPISVAIPILGISSYLILLIGVYLVFNLDFQIVYVIFLFTLIVFGVGGLMVKNSKMKSWIGKSMSGTIGAVYQSNLGKWVFILFSLFLILLAFPLIHQDLKGFSAFHNGVNLDESDYDWPEDRAYFSEANEQGRFPRVWTDQKTVDGESMNIYLARYARDARDLDRMNTLLQSDTIPWGKLESITDQYHLFVNDSLIPTEKWVNVQAGPSGQKSFMTQISISDLGPGIHEVRVEKLIYLAPFLGAGDELRHRKKWARFLFVKN